MAGTGEGIDTHAGATRLGVTIRYLRNRSGLSQHALAERCGTHRNYVSTLERGTVGSPGLLTVARFARELDVSVAVLAMSYVSAEATALPVRPLGGAPAAPHTRGGGGARELGHAIRALRWAIGLTQAQLADAVGMKRSYLASIEAGLKASPHLQTVARIARGLAGPQLGTPSALVGTLVQIFAGETSLDALRERLASSTFRPAGSSDFPLENAGN